MNESSETPISLSTVWTHVPAVEGSPTPTPQEEAQAILERLDQVGLTSLELEYRLRAPVLDLLLAELGPRGLSVVSLHNYIPIPPGMEKGSGDAFNLSSLDKEERLLAQRHTLASLQLASDLEVGALVVHLGSVEAFAYKGPTRDAARAGGMTPELARQLEMRAEVAPAHVDAASFSLERLLPHAERLGVSMGLENRYHAAQFPALDEAELLLGRFAGAPLGIWYDCGHAHAQALAGLGGALDWLDRLGGHLLGCHLHDAVGPDDHQAPGQGEMDWDVLCAALAGSPRKVMEIAWRASADQVRQGAAMLREKFARAAG